MYSCYGDKKPCWQFLVHISKESLEDIKRLKEQLAFYQIYSIGRYGSWTYCSIEDNIKEAQKVAQTISKS